MSSVLSPGYPLSVDEYADAPVEMSVSRRRELVSDLRGLVSDSEGVFDDVESLRAYESDGLTAYRERPLCVVLPSCADEVCSVLGYCGSRGVKVVPRGAGTSLSGGALPLRDGIVMSLSRMSRVLEIDVANRTATVEPGVTNLSVSESAGLHGMYYAPDPSSQLACTIGGNVAENAGGVRCLKYGLTSNNVLGLEVVTLCGSRFRLGGKFMDGESLDLLGAIVGSEGLLCAVTEATLRLVRIPEVRRAFLFGFSDVGSACACVSEVIGSGVIPAGMEMMDRLAISAAESFVCAGYPLDAEALLLIELDGESSEVSVLSDRMVSVATSCGATSSRVSCSEEERLRFWSGRKSAFPAAGRLSPDYYCMDGVIPRCRLAEVMLGMSRLSAKYGLRVANVFHAGDGNLHPLILYDADVEGELVRAESFGADILRLCLEAGGALSGEHGIGVEKKSLMPLAFDESDLLTQRRLKCAFDSDGLLNPGKMFPRLRRCAEDGRVHVHRGKLRFPELPRF